MCSINDILSHFQIKGKIIQVKRYGHGQINDTFFVKTDIDEYILQKINDTIFRDIPYIMKNIERLLSFSTGMYLSMPLIYTKECCSFYTDSNEKYWRMYKFVEGSYFVSSVQSPQNAFHYGEALGMFFDEFASFPQAELFSTFPDFHDTLHRYTEFEESVQLDKANRASSVDKDINLVRRMLPEIQQSVINKTNESIPQRVTHNDLKIDNILFSKANNSPICIVDLDTIMPGCIADDFGDAFRFAVTYSTENTVDLSKVYIDQHLFKMFTSGFWKKCGASLTNMEKSILLEQSKILTLECGMRMLTDYIQGDVYFPIDCPEHNLIRCRARFKLVHEIERLWDKLQCTIDHMDWFF